MAKKGMARPDWTHTHPRNDAPPVPEIQGKAKTGKENARPIIAGTSGPEMKVYHSRPHTVERNHNVCSAAPASGRFLFYSAR